MRKKQMEIKNLYARCIDKESIEEFALHEVEFDRKGKNGDWTNYVIHIMAKDPVDAINEMRRNK